MAYTVLGIFTTQQDAKDAIGELEEEGFDPKDLSLVMKNESEARELRDTTGANITEGAATGVATGALAGGLAGLLIGVGAIAIPGIGTLLIGGPLASVLGLTGAAVTTVSGATTGALAGGIIGALMGLGLPEEYANQYSRTIKSGGILLAVPAMTEDAMDVEDILYANGAEQVRSIDIQSSALYHGEPEGIQDQPEEGVYDQPLYHRPSYAFAGSKGGKTKRITRRAKNRRVR